VDKKWYDSVTYIGTRPTFHLMDKVIEVHIFDFDQTIYHHDITIRLLEFIRGDQDFKTSAGLIDQIKKDIKKSKELLKNINS
jgi:riboflavin kinase/FMN adenylyltransferase